MTTLLRSITGLVIFASLLLVNTAHADGVPQTDRASTFAHARALQEEGRVEEAVAAYRAFIRRYPGQPEAYNNLAVLLVARGEMDEARRVLLDGMQSHPGYAAIYENLNAITLEQARESYLKALRLGSAPRPPQMVSLDALTVSAPAAPAGTVLASAAEVAPTPPSTATDLPAAPVDTPTPVSTPGRPASPTPEVETDPAPHAPAAPMMAATPPDLLPQLTDVVADPLAVRHQELEDALNAWAAAWSARDADLYLSFYSASFRPGGGQDRARWARQRRSRLTRPRWIKVELEDIKVEVADAFHAVVRVRQHYRADNYEDVTLKRFTLKREADGWRIAREQSLRTLR